MIDVGPAPKSNTAWWDAKEQLYQVLNVACGYGREPAPVPELKPNKNGKQQWSNCIERYWKGQLHAGFEAVFQGGPVAVLSSARKNDEFRTNEFMYDLTAIEVLDKEVPSYRPGDPPVRLAVRQALWQVESEMSVDPREIAIDFAKLSCGTARNKLLVIRWQGYEMEPALNRFVLDLAENCSGNLFVMHVPAYPRRHQLLQIWTTRGRKIPYALYGRVMVDKTWLFRNISPTSPLDSGWLPGGDDDDSLTLED